MHYDEKRIAAFIKPEHQTVVVQGLGFVGAAMTAALVACKDNAGQPLYNVIGVDLDDENNRWKIDSVNKGEPPVVSGDSSLKEAYRQANRAGNLIATADTFAYSVADVVVVDVNVDIKKGPAGKAEEYDFSYEGLLKALTPVAEHIRENCLVILESTVPPGTTEKVVYPFFADKFVRRGLNAEKIMLVHSYERVMPGKNYLKSITDYYRVFAGINEKAASLARRFFSSFINIKEFPLTEMHSPTASETAKVLENSYRAMNIAFIREWSNFAEKAGIDLFQVLEAIRMRPTHNNIMSPGLGVGGYCLTKDALLADWANRNLYDANGLDMSVEAVNINDLMPDDTLKLLKRFYPDLRGKKVTILGVSYLHDVGDTRNTPTERLYVQLKRNGAVVLLHDSFVSFWPEQNIKVNTDLNSLREYEHDIVITAVKHNNYLKLSGDDIVNLFPGVKLVLDANNVITEEVAAALRGKNVKVAGVGKGHWNNGV